MVTKVPLYVNCVGHGGGPRVLKFCRMGILAMRNSIMRLPALFKLVRARLEYHRYLF